MALTMWIPIFISLFLLNLSTGKNHKVSVYLQAQWSETSLIAEASEFIAEESPELFWTFLDQLEPVITSGDAFVRSPSDEPTIGRIDPKVFKKLETLVSRLLPGNDGENLQLFRLFLSSRFFSPTVEMQNQVALTTASQLMNCSHSDAITELAKCVSGSSWAQVGNHVVCDLSQLSSLLQSSPGLTDAVALLTKEKKYPAPAFASQNIPTVILYGDLGSKDFYSWHNKLKSMAEAGTCSYVFRHYMKERSSTNPLLSGYGVELALKSTEYKAMDDSKPEDASSADNATSADDLVIRGFNFTHLQMNHPELTNELKEFQRHLIATDDELRPLKAWQFGQLGFQASQAIMDASVLGFIDADGVNHTNIHSGLFSLRDISQNFPVRASRLASSTVRQTLTEEVVLNQQVLSVNGISPGQTTLFLNGISISPTVDLFAFLALLKEEHRTMLSLRNLGIPNDKISDLMMGTDNAKTSSAPVPSIPGFRYSLSRRFALDLSKSPITYINNIESDSAYAYWPQSYLALLTDPSGGIGRVKRNLYNIILVIDPLAEPSRNWTQIIDLLLRHKIAMRFGFLWSIDPEVHSASLVLARIFSYLSSTIKHANQVPLISSLTGIGSPGAMAGLAFLNELYAEADKFGHELTVEFIQSRFEKHFPDAYIEDIITPPPGESDYDADIKLHKTFIDRSGLSELSNQPLLLFNGLIFDVAGVDRMGGFEDAVMTLCMEEMIRVQTAVFQGQLTDSNTIFDLYKRGGSIVPRFNARILNEQTPVYLNFGQTTPNADGTKDASAALQSFADRMRYFQKGDVESALRPLTIWVVVGDLDSILDRSSLTPDTLQQLSHDLSLARAAISHLRSAQASKGLRVGFVFNPAGKQQSSKHWLIRALHLVGHPTTPSGHAPPNATQFKFVEQMTGRNFASRLLTEALDVLKTKRADFRISDVLVSGIQEKSLESAIQNVDQAELLRQHAHVSRQVLGLKPGQRAVVVNGRIIGPFEPNEEFTVDDFRLVEKLALNTGVDKLGATLESILGGKLGGPGAISELTWRVASVLRPGKGSSSHSITDLDATEGILSRSRSRIQGLQFNHSGFEISTPSDSPVFDILAVVNPCSRDAQRLSHMLIVLQQALPCRFRVILNPVPALSELPVKSFYRFVWEPTLFSSKSGQPNHPHALFAHLPGQPLLTLGMDAPHGWMVAAVKAMDDLDNLRLADLHHNVEAVFELEHLLLEGHCFEGKSMRPPRGLQLTLGPTSDVIVYDTIVMANLGYFQLKSSPGSWHLSIRPGRSRDLYAVAEEEQDGIILSPAEVLVTIDSFRSKIVVMYVTKRPERMSEHLLTDFGGTTGSTGSADSWKWLYKNSAMWSTISDYAEKLCPSWLTSLRKSLQKHLPWQQCDRKQQTINVFSLASGHMYERLLRIMMLTVIRHTQSPVKFWFLKNYLSPTFKDFIPHMAAEYGFEYELVQYQWPRWLHAQTEKQRIIWGYKILFLDVLFPLNVTKIIFVDADQIVRADLQELSDLDLGGAPYGYTPFCDSRPEMDGFRFWKQGYWAAHLAGRPYHISALYVVDLVRFRQLAAGDRLRGQYHGLSQDPQSLSNLDQDLPNNMIHQVPIKSLPQEWLWCETWCSDESKERAKTIDLCNNPMTKEPKLSAAMRIAPEWVDYDREIKKLWRRIYPPVKQQEQQPTMQPADKGATIPPTGADEHCSATGCGASNPLLPPTTSAPSTSTAKQEL